MPRVRVQRVQPVGRQAQLDRGPQRTEPKLDSDNVDAEAGDQTGGFMSLHICFSGIFFGHICIVRKTPKQNIYAPIH